MNNIKVSACIISYNQEKFIAQCLESVINQVTNFTYEIVIGDDCSTDKTFEICRRYANQYPDKIKLLKRIKNLGMIGNWVNTLSECSGTYIALCEGDDYWTDNYKLQKQFDLLENNSELSFCFHKAYRFDVQNANRNKLYPDDTTKLVLDEKDFFKISTIPTASVFFRNQIKFPSLIHSHADMILYATLLTVGKAGFIVDKMSEYRLHSDGVSSKYGENWYLERRINELKIESKYKDFSKEVRTQISILYTNHLLLYLYRNRGNLSFNKKLEFLGKLFNTSVFYRISIKEYFRVLKIVFQ